MKNNGLFTKEYFDIIKKEKISIENRDIFLEKLDLFKFIVSIQLSTILEESKEGNNVIYSNILHLGGLDYGAIAENLQYKSYSNDLHILNISWVKTMSLNEKDDVDIKEYPFVNSLNEDFKIFVYTMSYTHFFNNLGMLFKCRSDIEKEKDENYLGINPIIIFGGLHLGNIIHLFKLNNINLNGGSISRRHKLSLAEYRLSIFLDIVNIFNESKDSFILGYKDNLFTSSRYDKGSEINPYIKQYQYINEYYSLNIKKSELLNEINNKNSVINRLKNNIESSNSNISLKNSEVDGHKNKIYYLKQSLVEGISSKHKASISGRLSNLRKEIDSLKSGVVKLQNEISQYEVKLSSELNNLNKLKVNLEKVLSNLSKSKSGIIPINIGKRQYHSLSSGVVKRYYSTDNSLKKINFNIDSPIFIELKRILNTSSLDDNTQLKIEQFLNDQGSILLNRRIDQNLDINYYKLNPYVLEYLKKYISELEKLINNYRSNILQLEASPSLDKDINTSVEILLISGLSNEVIISQLLGRLIRIISNNNLLNKNTSCTSLSIDLGKSLLYCFYSQEHKKSIKISKASVGLSNFIDENYSELNNNISDSVLFNIGLKIFSFLEEVGLIHSEIYVSSRDQKNLIYVCNSTILEYIGKNINLFSISYKIPMIVKPKPYYRNLNTGKDILGGFLLNDVEYISNLIIKNSEMKEQSKIDNKNIIFDAINSLSSVGYKINIPVLDFILENGLKYDLFTDPDFKHPLEIKKNTKQKLTLWEKKTLDAFLSRKQLELNILGLALIFKNIPEFFIPVRIDNRGRIYCMVDYLNYQGIELAKCLLLFSKGEKIYKSDGTAINYLKIFGANCYGNGIDKKSFNDRVEWVNNNVEDILNFSNGKLIKEADSKLLFIAFCFEYRNYYLSLESSDTYYISHFPVQLDATCNGYQHLSLLTGDEPLAGQLNLISGDNNTKPNDFYSYVGLKINDYLLHKKYEALNNREQNKEIIESCDRLLSMKINRSIVKLAIMVKPYNAGLLTMIDYIKDNFKKISSTENKEVFYILKADDNIKLNNYDFKLFVNTMEQVVYNEFPKLKEFNSYLNNVATICCILNITISWLLPSGLTVNQYYMDSEAIRLKPFKFRKNTYTLKINKNRINKSKQIRALMPNLIHSLDAASLCLIIDMFNQSYNNNSNRINFFCIHDCFAVTANNIENLIKIIKLVYIKIYSEDSYLKRFDQGIIDSIKLHFGSESFNDDTKVIKVNGFELDYPDVDKVILGRIKADLINKANSLIG